MKQLGLLSILLLTQLFATAAHASGDPEKIFEALYKLGVRQDGAKPFAAATIAFDDQGRMTESLGVAFDHIMGSSSLTAREVTVYQSDDSAYLVMSFASSEGPDFTSQRTQIFKVSTDESQLIANYVKANSDPVDRSTTQTLKINAYSLKYISCGHVVYPGAKTTCSSN